jgi:hypothetical protein
LDVLFFVLRPDFAADRSQKETFDLAIEEGAMAPDQITVDEGDRVSLRVYSDRPLEFHLHGYDVSEAVVPGEPVELSFDATITGRFEIEDEKTREELGMLIVRPH